MCKKFLSALLLAVFSLGFSMNAFPADVNLGAKSAKSSAIKSLILPGWGQLANGQKKKGYLMMLIAVAGAGGAYYMNSQATATYDKYTAKGIITDPLYDDYQSQIDKANYSLAVYGVCLAYSVFDAYRVGKTMKKVSLNIQPEKVSLAYNIKF